MNITKKYILTAAMLALALLPTAAQEQTEIKPTATEKGWYVGAQGGVPMGVSTFSSFGADKTRVGWSAGLFGGYRFNPVLSLEATAKLGQINLASQDCCIEHNLWLGADGVRYNAPVLDMNGWGYGELKSSVFTQHYGLQLNVNVLGFFNKTKHSRWTLEVSPLVAAVGTKSTVKTIADNAEVAKGKNRWHLGVGGNLQAGFQVCKHVKLGLYSGITYLSGKRMDGMPEFRHKANYVWESGLKLGFTFGKGKRKAAPAVEETPEIVEKVMEVKDIKENKDVTEVKETPATPSAPIAPEAVSEPKVVELPTIYFAFNSSRISSKEMHKLEEIKAQMEANPEMKIRVDGWCDRHGSKAVNARISQQRADAVKAWLTAKGIAADRIATKGNGSDFDEPVSAKARRVESVTIKPE